LQAEVQGFNGFSGYRRTVLGARGETPAGRGTPGLAIEHVAW
jgi:hypothetical protein